MEAPESIKNLTREELEKFALDLLHHDHEQTHRANDLEEIIEEAIDFLKEFHNYENRFKWCEEDYITTILAIEKILNKFKGDSND